MINLCIKNLHYNKFLLYGINSFLVKHRELYRKIYLNLEDELIISFQNGVILKDSEILIIKNVLDYNINDKKNLLSLYKSIELKIKFNYREEFINIRNLLLSLIIKANEENDFLIDFNDEDTYNKIFQFFNLSYIEEKDKFIDYLIKTFKNINFHSNVKVIITFNLINILEVNELSSLNDDLEKLQIILLDISPTYHLNNISLKTVLIDEDLTII